MTIKAKKNTWNNLYFLGILIIVVLIFTSCGGQEAVKEPAENVPEPHEKMEQLKQELTEKENIINQLKKENSDLQDKIPLPYEVQKGDNHWAIAYDYLTRKRGLPSEEAKKVLNDAFLFNPIRAGSIVWNYYDNNAYGSFLTQGNAPVSPSGLMLIKRRKTEKEKLLLESAITRLNDEYMKLVKKMEQMEREHESLTAQLNDQITSLNQHLEETKSDDQNLESKLNSMYYLVGTEDELKSSGKIDGTFLGLGGIHIKDVTFADFQNRTDLRKTDSIELNVSDLDVPQIKDVEILPNHLEKGQDYRIEIAGDHRSARVILLNKAKFLLSRIIVVLN